MSETICGNMNLGTLRNTSLIIVGLFTQGNLIAGRRTRF